MGSGLSDKGKTGSNARGRGFVSGNMDILDGLEEELDDSVLVLLCLVLHQLDLAHGLLLERLVVVCRRYAVLHE